MLLFLYVNSQFNHFYQVSFDLKDCFIFLNYQFEFHILFLMHQYQPNIIGLF